MAQENVQVIMTSFRKEAVECADKLLLVQNEQVREISDPEEIGEDVLR